MGFFAIPVVMLGAVIACNIVSLERQRRSHVEFVRHGPMVHTGLTPAHEPILGAVHAMEDHGYRVAVVGEGPARIPTVLLAHPDGSVGIVEARGLRGGALILVSSCLVPGRQWLLTHGGTGGGSVSPNHVTQTVARLPDAEASVVLHRRMRGILRDEGLAFSPVGADQVALDRHARAEARVAGRFWGPIFEAVIFRRRHAVDDPGWVAKMAQLRRAQAGVAAGG